MALIAICAMAVVGLAAGDVAHLEPGRLVAASLLAAAGAAFGWRNATWRVVALAALAVALGALRATTDNSNRGTPQDSDALLSSLLQGAAAMRAAAEGHIRAGLPEPQASLAAGVLLGGSGRVDAGFRLDLQRSGLAHLVAIDGFKQVVVAAALGAIAVRLLGARMAAVPTIAGIVGYTLLTGAHPAAIRAALMVSLAILGALVGRVADPLTSLLLALVTMAGLQPRILLDVGLQLSASATLGIVLLWPRLRRRLRRLPRFVAEPVGLTLAVTVATLPVVLARFQTVSLISPAAHVLALPLLPAVLVSAAVLAAVGPLPLLGMLAGWAAWLPSTLLVEIIKRTGSLPGAALSTGRLPALAAACLAAALLAWGVAGLPELAAARSAMHTRWRSVRAAAAPLVALAALGLLNVARPDGRLHVERLEAGRGYAYFIRAPSGRTALVVAGRIDSLKLLDQLPDHLAVWEHKLDSAVALDAAGSDGLRRVLDRYPADRLLAPADAQGACLAANPSDANQPRLVCGRGGYELDLR